MTEPIPEVMFLPLAVPEHSGFGSLDAGVLARRLPDFVHQVLNQGQHGPTGMLEVQTPPDEGAVSWVVMDAPPEPEEAFALVPDGELVRAVVTGEVVPVKEGLRVEFHAYFVEDMDDRFTSKVGGVVALANPVPSLLQLIRRLARMLELPYHEPPKGLLTGSGRAFFSFLHGLDNAMLLSGDLQIALPVDRVDLMRPFAEALQLDPGFGLALRVAHSTLAMALQVARLEKSDCQHFLDRCYSSLPVDGEGCVAVAEQLREMGDDLRAIQWLQHATHLDPPPARGLENLGIIFANRGDTIAARDLWLRGVDVDGHPDFFAHLARLYFAEGSELDAWNMVLRGLRRLHERSSRLGEWDEHERGAGVLLEYLQEHLGEASRPPELSAALLELRSMLAGADRVDLGLCLYEVGCRVEARRELIASLELEDLEPEARDHAVRALLKLDVTNFEKRFAKAADLAMRGRNPRSCFADFQLFLELQPDFWPALFFSAVGKRRLGQGDEALDLLAEALRIYPDQPDALHQMALLFDERGNPKHALELIEKALAQRSQDSKLLAAKVSFLVRLGQKEAAKQLLKTALSIDATDRDLLRIKKQIEG